MVVDESGPVDVGESGGCRMDGWMDGWMEPELDGDK
jgi:hypothetical protein